MVQMMLICSHVGCMQSHSSLIGGLEALLDRRRCMQRHSSLIGGLEALLAPPSPLTVDAVIVVVAVVIIAIVTFYEPQQHG